MDEHALREVVPDLLAGVEPDVGPSQGDVGPHPFGRDPFEDRDGGVCHPPAVAPSRSPLPRSVAFVSSPRPFSPRRIGTQASSISPFTKRSIPNRKP